MRPNQSHSPNNSTSVATPKNLMQLGILVASFALLFGPTIAEMISDWSTNGNYSHGFIVPVIAGYMIWHKKDQLVNWGAHPSNVGFPIIMFGMCVFILGNIGAELFVSRTAIVITIAGLCISAFGLRIAKAVAVPLAYLMFMIPMPAIIWNKIAFPMQLFASGITATVVQFINIPLLQEGNLLCLPNTTLEVVDACSGLRSLTSLLALSAPFAYIMRLSGIGKWILFLSAIPIAVVANIFRLTSTAMLATYVGAETAQGFLHDLSGILVFGLSLVLLYGLYLIIRLVEQMISIGFKKTISKKNG